MAYNFQAPVTVVEFGTDKICVMHGRRDDEGNAEVLAFAQVPSNGCVRKGLIVDYEAAVKLLGIVLERADRAMPFTSERKNVYFLLNGLSIESRRGEGTVMIHGGEITNQNVCDALEKAHGLSLPQGTVSFGSYDSFFVVNRSNRVKDPTGLIADQLDAYVHIITGNQQQIERIRMILRDIGFDRGTLQPVFNGIASVFGVLRADEREQGVLLIDFGLGVCNYVLICAEGVYLSGVLGVGISNVANDLALGLDLPYDFCLKFLREGKMTKLRAANTNILEYTVSVTGKKRRIPLDSFEKIMELRLREIFSIIRGKVMEKKLSSCMTSGIVLCGGGALLEGAQSIAQDVFTTTVRIGEPIGFSGVRAGFESAPVCYASSLGLLKYAIEDENARGEGSIGFVRSTLTGVAESMIGKLRQFGKVFSK